MSDVTQFVRRTKNAVREDINKLLGLITPFAFPAAEDEGIQERIVLSVPRRIRTQTAPVVGQLDVTQTDTRNYEDGRHKRQNNASILSYPLTHVTTGTLSPEKALSDEEGAGVFTDGSSYITITDQATLDVTTDLTIAFYLKPRASSGDGLLVHKNNAYEVKLQDTNTLAFRVFSGGAWKTAVTYDYTADIGNWISVVCTYKSAASGQKLYVENVLQDSDSETGAIDTNANDLKILGDGISDSPANTSMAWLRLFSTEVDATYVGNFHDHFTDYSSITEITSIDFIGDESPTPQASSGFCSSA